MTLSEVFDNQSMVLYYPFSCTDFAIVNPLSEGIPHPTSRQLFVFCSVDIPEQISVSDGEQTNMSYYPIENLENKLGLAGLEILSVDAIDEEPNMMYYTFTNQIRLLFVKDDAFRFARTMQALLLTNDNVCLVINGCGEFNNCTALIDMFYPIAPLQENQLHFIVIESQYVNAADEYFTHRLSGEYQVREQIASLPMRDFFIYHRDEKSQKTYQKLQNFNKVVSLI
jgi:hypothetical protein